MAYLIDMSVLVPAFDPIFMSSDEPAARETRSVGAKSSPTVQSTLSDEELLTAVGNTQDVQAFEDLFKRFSGKIFALGMKLTRNEQLSRDLVQEAMLKVWQKAPLFDMDKGSAQNWIFTLTRNRCFDALRKLKRQPQTVNADDVFGPGYEFEDAAVAGEEMVSVEVAEIVRISEQLPIAQQEVIKQIYVLDRTHEEASQELNIPLGTLKSRLRLGIARLQQLIGDSK
ncbi:MAG: sigma-70 family RNA polymerase sigma factor [Gammaproteobacteria bacterium]